MILFDTADILLNIAFFSIFIVVKTVDDQGDVQLDVRDARYIWDQISYYLVIYILINVICGVIVDYFSELRDKELNRMNVFENYCFICGIHKTSVENITGGFAQHIKIDHNMWNYVFFVNYVKNKPKQDRTSVERKVVASIENEDIEWFPINTSAKIE